MGPMLNLLENYELGDIDLRDEIIWNLDVNKGFSVKLMYGSLCP